MVQSAVSSFFGIDESHLSSTYDWLDLPFFTVSLSWKSVSPPPSWFSHDVP